MTPKLFFTDVLIFVQEYSYTPHFFTNVPYFYFLKQLDAYLINFFLKLIFSKKKVFRNQNTNFWAFREHILQSNLENAFSTGMFLTNFFIHFVS